MGRAPGRDDPRGSSGARWSSPATRASTAGPWTTWRPSAEVSRRTVFNYFDGKADLVLGPIHETSADTAAAFVAGGPSGRLFDDLVHFASEALQEKGADLELVRLRRDVMRSDARVIAIAHARFEVITEDAVDLILQREGKEYGATRARLLVQLLITIVDSVLGPVGARPQPAAARPHHRCGARRARRAHRLIRRNPATTPPGPGDPHGPHALPPRLDRLPAVAPLPRRLARLRRRARERGRGVLQADVGRVHHPRHPVGAGRGPPAGAVPRGR